MHSIVRLFSQHLEKREKIGGFKFLVSFRASDGANSEDRVGGNSPSGNIKNAAQKSFRASKNTVEETAKSAAEVVGESMHKTAGKVKESVSDKKDESEAEL